jgi:uncharacterized protein (DUF2164 family)
MHLSSEQRTALTSALREFLDAELDVTIGTFEADDLADFVIEKLGPWFYNQGLLDARARLGQLIDGIQEELSLLEKASPLDR